MTNNAVVGKTGPLDVLRGQRYPEGAEVLADRGFNGLETDLIKIGTFLATPPSSRGRLDETRFSKETPNSRQKQPMCGFMWNRLSMDLKSGSL